MSLNLTTKEQIQIMERQLGAFNSLMEKMQYMSMFFDCDPDFTQKARNIVRSNLCKNIQ